MTGVLAVFVLVGLILGISYLVNGEDSQDY